MVAIYKFTRRGKWVSEKSPGYYFWTQVFHSNSVLKFVLWDILDNILLRVCLRLNGEWRLPLKFQTWAPIGIITLRKGRVVLDPRGWLSHVFWFKDFERYEKPRQ